MWIVELYPRGDDQDADFYGPFPMRSSATKFLINLMSQPIVKARPPWSCRRLCSRQATRRRDA